MKYITLMDRNNAVHCIVFGESLIHSDVARGICRASGIAMSLEPRSAGFVDFGDDGYPKCHGRSESMDLGTMESDQARIYLGDSVRFLDDAALMGSLKYLLSVVQSERKRKDKRNGR